MRTWTQARNLVLLSALGLALAASADPAVSADAESLVERYNGRELGAPGWRRVGLELRDGDRVSRSFTVVNAWSRAGSELRTLFLLEAPASLAGTSYLLVERPDAEPGIQVHLFLPAGRRRVLTIEPGRFDEGLLGSDFSYRDLRLQIPTRGHRFRYAGEHRIQGRSAHAVDAEPSHEGQGAWSRVRYYFDRESPVLLGIDYFAAGEDRPGKRLRVEDFRQIDGAWTETRMVMRTADGRSSVLTLQGFEPFTQRLVGLRKSPFAPESLPEVADLLAADEAARDDQGKGRSK